MMKRHMAIFSVVFVLAMLMVAPQAAFADTLQADAPSQDDGVERAIMPHFDAADDERIGAVNAADELQAVATVALDAAKGGDRGSEASVGELGLDAALALGRAEDVGMSDSGDDGDAGVVATRTGAPAQSPSGNAGDAALDCSITVSVFPEWVMALSFTLVSIAMVVCLYLIWSAAQSRRDSQAL